MQPAAKSISFYNFPKWCYRTAAHDFRKYQIKQRPISMQRLCRAVFPNLKKPIFIIGCGRSGTTFLGSCVSELPEVSYHFEPILPKAAVRYVYGGKWGFDWASKLYKLIYAWLMRLHLDGDLRFAEKTPRNSFIIPFLYKAFPDARFIHIVRDGRDVTVSLLHKPWYRADASASGKTEPGGYAYGPYARFWVEPERVNEFETTSDTHRCIWLWRRYMEHLIEATSMLPKEQYHELRYESLVESPTLEADRILDFLEISEEKSRSSFQTAISNVQSSSVGRWQKELSGAQLEQIENEAGHYLTKLNYVSTCS